MRIEHEKLGTLEIPDDRILTFPEGIPGFSDARRFGLLDVREGSFFRWLAALDRPELALLVADPFLFFPGYEAPLEDRDLAALSYRKEDELILLSVVTVRGRRREDTTFNLRAPVVINPRTLRGKQVLLKEERWGIRVPFPAIAPSPCGGKDRKPAAL
ncbi:MAG: flagellar assembly protein FliW [Deltaproteobacteria bacterium]